MTGHGGNIYLAAQEIGMPEEKIIDFSASINPLGVPESAISEIRNNAKNLFNYPAPDAAELRQSLSEYHRVSPESIICGNGSTELIYLIARALKPKKVLIPAPTFSEYERACLISQKPVASSQKSAIKYLELDRNKGFEIDPDAFIYAMRGCDVAFLCNPNNPTGRLLRREDVKKIADAAKKIKCYLLLDEAFIDFCPGNSLIDEVQKNSYLIVLRSMTKIYALSGLRIGYGVFPQHLIKKLNMYKEPWTVNTLAQKAGIAALNDKAYVKKALALIKKEKKYLEDSFRKIGIKFFQSDPNFYLLKINHAHKIYQALKHKGILVRDCSNFRGLNNNFIRVAVKARKENKILMGALRNALAS